MVVALLRGLYGSDRRSTQRGSSKNVALPRMYFRGPMPGKRGNHHLPHGAFNRAIPAWEDDSDCDHSSQGHAKEDACCR